MQTKKTYLRFEAVKILCGVFRAKWQTKSEKCPFSNSGPKPKQAENRFKDDDKKGPFFQ